MFTGNVAREAESDLDLALTNTDPSVPVSQALTKRLVSLLEEEQLQDHFSGNFVDITTFENSEDPMDVQNTERRRSSMLLGSGQFDTAKRGAISEQKLMAEIERLRSAIPLLKKTKKEIERSIEKERERFLYEKKSHESKAERLRNDISKAKTSVLGEFEELASLRSIQSNIHTNINSFFDLAIQRNQSLLYKLKLNFEAALKRIESEVEGMKKNPNTVLSETLFSYKSSKLEYLTLQRRLLKVEETRSILEKRNRMLQKRVLVIDADVEIVDSKCRELKRSLADIHVNISALTTALKNPVKKLFEEDPSLLQTATVELAEDIEYIDVDTDEEVDVGAPIALERQYLHTAPAGGFERLIEETKPKVASKTIRDAAAEESKQSVLHNLRVMLKKEHKKLKDSRNKLHLLRNSDSTLEKFIGEAISDVKRDILQQSGCSLAVIEKAAADLESIEDIAVFDGNDKTRVLIKLLSRGRVLNTMYSLLFPNKEQIVLPTTVPSITEFASID
ncbi:hypothetical protein PCE1_000567 [Barthelona sp. PCE]